MILDWIKLCRKHTHKGSELLFLDPDNELKQFEESTRLVSNILRLKVVFVDEFIAQQVSNHAILSLGNI